MNTEKTPKNAQQRAKKGLFRIIFSRVGIIAILIVFQILFLVGTLFFLREYLPWIYGASIIIEAVVIIYLINSKSNPAFKNTWMLMIFVFPFVGMVFYVFTRFQPELYVFRNRLAKNHIETKKYREQDAMTFEAIWASKSANALLAHYMNNSVGYPTYRNTRVVYFSSGEEKFEAMIKLLQKAKKFIFLEYFIIEEGFMWDSILNILKEKIAEGVEVRLLYDGMGCLTTLPWDYPKEMEKIGIKCHVVSSLKPFLSTIQNNRDHRKILVIDGVVGITGGVNLADEYINKKKRFGHWKDTAVMLQGEAVQSFTMMFLEMWNTVTGEEADYKNYLVKRRQGFRREYGYVIPYADSPFDDENVGEEIYFHIINHAKRYVHIMTPYLILDNEMITTLTRSAKSGIEVIIIMPHIPDKWYAYALAKTYYKELIEAGVQIYEYNPGFVHAKVFVSDDDTATVGTINLDYRSLYLHFECGVFIYNNSEVTKIEDDFQMTLKKCHKVSLLEVKKRSLFYVIVGKALRLFAPLM